MFRMMRQAEKQLRVEKSLLFEIFASIFMAGA